MRRSRFDTKVLYPNPKLAKGWRIGDLREQIKNRGWFTMRKGESALSEYRTGSHRLSPIRGGINSAIRHIIPLDVITLMTRHCED
jgi:hypothetical protein